MVRSLTPTACAFACVAIAACASVFAQTPAPARAPAGASELVPYVRADKLTGTVKAAGSSTVAALLKQVTDAFASVQPGVDFDIGGAGSSSALASMLEDPTAMGLLSRPMTQREKDGFRAKYGYAPTEVKIAVDAVAIYAFKGNPVKALSLTDLRRAFGRDPDAADRWGALGLTGEWADRPIARFGLERGRGAFELFREIVLEGSEFNTDVDIEPVSTSVVQGVAVQPGGLGYASVFFRTDRTRIVPISHKGEIVEPTAQNALSGKYPLARFLYVYVNKKPDAAMNALQRQFLMFALSRDGQAIVAKQGFYALDGALAREAMANVGASAPAAEAKSR